MTNDLFGDYKSWLASQKEQGITQDIAKVSETILEEMRYSPAYQSNAKRNGTTQPMIVTRKEVKKCLVTVMPNSSLNIGDVIEVFSEHWLCMSTYKDEYNIIYGEIWLSNYTMTFQNGNSTVITKYAIIDDGSYQKIKDQSIKLPENTYNCYVQSDSDTAKLYIDKRLAIDTIYDRNGDEILEVVKISGIDRKTYNLGTGSHLLKIRVDADIFNSEKDNVSLKICDYITTSSNSTASSGELSIYGRDSIRIGTSRKYTAKGISQDGNSVDLQNVRWSLVNNTLTDITITTDVNGACSLNVPLSENLIGESIELSCEDIDGNYQSGTKEVEVIPIG